MQIRAIDSSELPAVHRLAHRIWPAAYDFLLSSAQVQNLLDAIYNLPQLEQDMRSGHVFWLAEDAGEAVGFASAYAEGDVMWLRKLYVLPEVQGKGAGRALLAAATERFAACREIRLNVNAGNHPAINTYTRWGFVALSSTKVQMGDYWFDDLVMRKPLAQAA